MTRPRLLALTLSGLCLAPVWLSGPAFGQDGGLPWEGDQTLYALSTTAMAITGDISISGPEEEKVITTASGAEIWLALYEARSSGWSLTDGEVWPGMIYEVTEDPGALEGGNTLCGTDPALFAVLSPIGDDMLGDYVQIAFFSGDAPENIESPGLCGTLNYARD